MRLGAMSMSTDSKWWLMLRVAVAMVWLYQGFWLKIIAADDRHLAIVGSAPAFISPRAALVVIGVVESFFGIAVLLRWRRRAFALLQICTLFAMNIAGIAFAAERIPDIGGMVTMNLVFALAIWGLARHAP